MKDENELFGSKLSSNNSNGEQVIEIALDPSDFPEDDPEEDRQQPDVVPNRRARSRPPLLLVNGEMPHGPAELGRPRVDPRARYLVSFLNSPRVRAFFDATRQHLPQMIPALRSHLNGDAAALQDPAFQAFLHRYALVPDMPPLGPALQAYFYAPWDPATRAFLDNYRRQIPRLDPEVEAVLGGFAARLAADEQNSGEPINILARNFMRRQEQGREPPPDGI